MLITLFHLGEAANTVDPPIKTVRSLSRSRKPPNVEFSGAATAQEGAEVVDQPSTIPCLAATTCSAASLHDYSMRVTVDTKAVDDALAELQQAFRVSPEL